MVKTRQKVHPVLLDLSLWPWMVKTRQKMLSMPLPSSLHTLYPTNLSSLPPHSVWLGLACSMKALTAPTPSLLVDTLDLSLCLPPTELSVLTCLCWDGQGVAVAHHQYGMLQPLA